MSESWRNFQTSLYLLVVCIILFVADRGGLAKPARLTVDFITLPVQQVIHEGVDRVSSEILIFWELRKISHRYNALEKQYNQSLANYINLSQVNRENEILKRQFASSQNETQKLLPAEVIGISRYLIISQGAENGVKTGQVVVLENSLIGRVVAVSPKSSRVLLPTDPESKITAYIQRTDRGPKGIVIGAFGSSMRLEKILPEEKIEVGDLLLTAGDVEGDFGYLYPKNLLIGRVTEVNKSDSDLFQGAEMLPIFDYQHLETVFVRLD